MRGSEPTWGPGAIVAGAYRLEAPIGKGGMGAVFRGARVNNAEPVAIKLLLRAAMLRDDSVARFEREAALAMKLQHPSTIRVLDSGDAGDGTPFIAFELLTGRSLDQRLADGPLDEDTALAVTRSLLGSLAEAHGLGIVHRDVKPQNVFLCDAPSGLAKLLDFGVAKSTLSGEGGLTGEGIMVGTPAYMSPEQINGTEVSPATDLYAVALVFAEMLTGKPVYDAAPLMVCMDKVRNLPVPFAEQLKRSAYFEVLDRATRLDPGARYNAASEMLRALEGRRSAPDAGLLAAAGHGHAPSSAVASSQPRVVSSHRARHGTEIMMLPSTGPSSTEVIAVPPVLANVSRDAFGATFKAGEEEAAAAPGPAQAAAGAPGRAAEGASARPHDRQAQVDVVGTTLPLGDTTPFQQQELRAALGPTEPERHQLPARGNEAAWQAVGSQERQPPRPNPSSSGTPPVAPPTNFSAPGDGALANGFDTVDDPAKPPSRTLLSLVVKLLIVGLLIAAIVTALLLRKRLWRRWAHAAAEISNAG